MTLSSSDLSEHATEMTTRDLLVFPLATDSKKPPAGSRWKDDASREATGAHWKRATGYGVALPGDVFVLDIDPLSGGDESLRDLEREHGPLPTTLSVCTIHGDGQHYYLRTAGPIRNSAGTLAPGLDIRGEGGYVVGPGSQVRCDDGMGHCEKDESETSHCDEYVLLADCDEIAAAPEWLLDLLEQPLAHSQSPAADAGQLIPRGARNDFLTREAGALRGRGYSVQVVRAAVFALNERMLDEPLGEDELESTVMRSMASWGAGELLIPDLGYDPSRIQSAGEVVAPCRDPLVHDDNSVVIARGTATQVVAREGVGKTTLLQHLALSFATATPWLGFTVARASVLYLGIDRPGSQADSFMKLRGRYDDPGELLNCYFAPVGNLLKEPARLLNMVQRADAEVLIIDSLYALAPLGESLNDDTWARSLARSLATLATNDVTVLIAAHPPRNTTDRDRTTNAAGSRFQSAGMDNVINLSRKGTVTFSMDKGFGGPEPFSLTIDATTRALRRLGQDIDARDALSTFAPRAEITKRSFALAMGWDDDRAGQAKAERLLEKLAGVELVDSGGSGGRGGGAPKTWKRVT